MSVISNNALKQIAWFGVNVLTTLLIVTTLGGGIGSTGPAGSNGSNGTNGENGLPGLDGGAFEYGSFDYDNSPLSDDVQDAYVAARLDEGYIALDSAADFARFNMSGGLSAAEAYANYSLKYVLTDDINFATEGESSVFYEFLSDQASSHDYISFTGVFDGAGYTIANYTETLGENYDLSHGFFKSLDGATIKNLTFNNIQIAAAAFSGNAGIVVGFSNNSHFVNVFVQNSIVVSDTHAGGLIGATDDEGYNYLLNVHITDSLVHGNEHKGGLIGYNSKNGDNESLTAIVDSSVENVVLDTVEESDLSAFPEWFTFDNSNYAGGFIGTSDQAGSIYIYNSFNTSNIQSDSTSGGFIGYIDYIHNLYIVNSFNSGSIFTDDALGGFVGTLYLQGEFVVQNSFNAGDLYTEDDDIGGIVADVYYDDSQDDASVWFNNVYNSGSITVSETGNDVGGLIAYLAGYVDVTITNSFNVGTFSRNLVLDDLEETDINLGGIIGSINGFAPLFNNVFVFADSENSLDYLAKVTGNGFSAGARVISDIEDFTEADFRLSNKWNFETIWEFTEDSLFPILQDLEFSKVGLDFDFKPNLGWYYYSFETDFALGFTYFDLEFSAYDFETPSEDLIVKMYLTNQYYEGSLEGFLEIATLLGTFAGDEVVGDFTYTTAEAGQYYIWFYVEDSVGNYEWYNFSSFNTQID